MSKATPSRGAQPRLRKLTRAILLATLASTPALVLAQASSYTETGKIGDARSWQTEEFKIDWGLGAVGADEAYARGLSGKGVKVGVYDDGFPAWHPDLEGITPLSFGDPGCESGDDISQNGCFHTESGTTVTYTAAPTAAQDAIIKDAIAAGTITQRQYDALQTGFVYGTHGSHVAGIAGGRRDGSGMHGVAFNAGLVGAASTSNIYMDALSALGLPDGSRLNQGPGLEAEAAMRELMNKAGVRVVNNSWGLGTEPKTAAEMDAKAASDYKVYLDALAADTRKYGMLQVFAAGNDSGQIAGIWATLPRYYADVAPYWVSVANAQQDGTLHASSSICGLSKDWCITAPGAAIISTVPAGNITGELLVDDADVVTGVNVTAEEKLAGYAEMTGTSMASPHVTGGLALLMERYPYLTNPQVRDVLLTTARDLGEAGVDEIYGWGMMDLKKAIDGPGMLRVDTDVLMDQHAGGAKVWEGEAWDDWRNDISGPGKLSKSGEGWLRLSGRNTFAGATVKQGTLELAAENQLGGSVQVAGGTLLLNGALVDTRLEVESGVARVNGLVRGGETVVAMGGRLEGTGTLSNTVVGGTISPDGRGTIGTLTVNGNYTQQAGSVYEVDVQAPTSSDLVQVTGSAVLEGGTIQVDAAAVELGQSYTILRAADITGSFGGVGFASATPFMTMAWSQTSTALALNAVRGQALTSAAYTDNQMAVAGAADAASDSDPFLSRLVHMNAAQATAAFDQLSGEAYASQTSVLLDQGQRMNELVVDRTRTSQTRFAQQGDDGRGNNLWVDVQSHGGDIDSNDNAARTRYHANGLTLGYDYIFGDQWQVGAVASAQKGDMNVRQRGSKHDYD
ncbi:S8 family serine peptidase, partial [Pseudoxanthomonas indica]